MSLPGRAGTLLLSDVTSRVQVDDTDGSSTEDGRAIRCRNCLRPYTLGLLLRQDMAE